MKLLIDNLTTGIGCVADIPNEQYLQCHVFTDYDISLSNIGSRFPKGSIICMRYNGNQDYGKITYATRYAIGHEPISNLEILNAMESLNG